jgi:hypothetical protein
MAFVGGRSAAKPPLLAAWCESLGVVPKQGYAHKPQNAAKAPTKGRLGQRCLQPAKKVLRHLRLYRRRVDAAAGNCMWLAFM